jgi:cobalt-zinc-cadmium efflux system outer membrane protein
MKQKCISAGTSEKQGCFRVRVSRAPIRVRSSPTAPLPRSLIPGLALLAVVTASGSAGAEPAPAARSAPAPSAAPKTAPGPSLLRELIELARARAPEVTLGQVALTASRATAESGRVSSFGNPALEVKVDHGTQGVTKDVTIDASLWLPVELAGEKAARGRESRDYIHWHEALLQQARAQATGRTVRAYGAFAVAVTRVKALEDLLSVAQAEAHYYAGRLEHGDATEREAAMAALEVARHEVMLSETQGEVVRQSGELAELTGRNLAAEGSFDPNPPIPNKKFEEAPARGDIPSARALDAESRYYAAARERLSREGYNPLALALTGGRGDYGEARFGAGIAYAWPLLRTNQPERARADAARVRALQEAKIRRGLVTHRVGLIEAELVALGKAVEVIQRSALPAANRAVQAAVETQHAGKGDWLSVLVSRRDVASLTLRRLELLDKCWVLLSELSEVTGELP